MSTTDKADKKDVSFNYWKRFSLVVLFLLFLSVIYLMQRFMTDRPVEYNSIEEHFKYGSLGGERNLGIPYWLWRVAPKICEDLLPNKQSDDIGYESVGMIYEEGNTLPVGVSSRRQLGLDRVFFNCAICHTSTVKQSPSSTATLILGMPANRFDLMGFERFIFQCMASQQFNTGNIIPTIEEMGAELDLIDKYLVYPLAVWITKERLALLASRLGFFTSQPDWGPGRVDTFNAAKAIFNWDWSLADKAELIGTADFPSIWNQQQRKIRDDGNPMELHWDGNNDTMEERNLSAAFGAGAIPPIVDHEALGRIENWLLDLKPPSFPFNIDKPLAKTGQEIYQSYCANCHGNSGNDFKGKDVGHVVPIEAIATDEWRLNSYTQELAVNQGTLYTGDERYRFKRFRKTFGYANMPLDGIWLRAPYLHNGSVLSIRELLMPVNQRTQQFYRGNDLYDPINLGFVSDVEMANGKPLFLFDTRIKGNSNKGHEGKTFGTLLMPSEKNALLEYLKTF